ncbi:uncharacterized protein [Onthophagus taurus]|uniref:uncharacterized protein isoform X2 n=1 Tax=Onthophagus taurus TaxID=166361 RepID=UPI000C1FE7AD|nr:uncharacterized protein LOC111420291 isoform X2 [Onthophagus taurus]
MYCTDRILRLQRIVLTFIVILTMSPIMAPALSTHEPGCNNKNIKLKKFISSAAQGYLAIVNNTLVTTVSDSDHLLYTINGAKRSAQFYLFDPKAKMFICATKPTKPIKSTNSTKPQKRKRFIPKKIPNPAKLCLFDEVIDEEKTGEIKLKVQNNTLNVSNNRRRHKKKYEYFIPMCDSRITSTSVVDDLCKLLPAKAKRMFKTKQLINCPA